MKVTLDVETYSEAGFLWNGAKWERVAGAAKYGISAVGAVAYLQHPTAELLCASWAIDDGPAMIWRPGMPATALHDAVRDATEIEAWNASFEVNAWYHLGVVKLGWPSLDLSKVRCAMAAARAFALPGSLENAGKVLNLSVQKDKEGGKVLNLFSVPRQPTKGDPSTRVYPSQVPASAATLYRYNQQDVLAERAISKVVPPLIPQEVEWWQVEQECNRRGVHVDVPLVRGASAILSGQLEEGAARLRALTGDAVRAVTETGRMQTWLASLGVFCDSMDDDAVQELLSRPTLPAAAREVLEIRSRLGSAAVRKFTAIERQLCAGDRLHDLFVYHGARTGRETGEGPQPQNLPNSGPNVYRCESCSRHYQAGRSECPWCGLASAPREAEEWSAEAAADAITLVRRGDPAPVAAVFGRDILPILSGCIRGVFNASPGYVMMGADYSAIEGVGAAMLAGEPWRAEVFRTHGKIYEMGASKAFHVPLDELLEYRKRTGKHHPLRKKGKVGELAGGYGGGKGAWRQFGAEGTDEELQQQVDAWRAASPNIVASWRAMQYAWADAIARPGERIAPTKRAPNVLTPERLAKGEGDIIPGEIPGVYFVFSQSQDLMRMFLPSGRCLTYHSPRATTGANGWGIDCSFWGWNTNPKMGPYGWINLRTFGGRLFENLVQATCRDLLTFAGVNVVRAGFTLLLHVHDELCVEVPKAQVDHLNVEILEAIMATPPDWAKSWPIRVGGGWQGERYQK